MEWQLASSISHVDCWTKLGSALPSISFAERALPSCRCRDIASSRTLSPVRLIASPWKSFSIDAAFASAECPARCRNPINHRRTVSSRDFHLQEAKKTEIDNFTFIDESIESRMTMMYEKARMKINQQNDLDESSWRNFCWRLAARFMINYIFLVIVFRFSPRIDSMDRLQSFDRRTRKSLIECFSAPSQHCALIPSIINTFGRLLLFVHPKLDFLSKKAIKFTRQLLEFDFGSSEVAHPTGLWNNNHYCSP